MWWRDGNRETGTKKGEPHYPCYRFHLSFSLVCRADYFTMVGTFGAWSPSALAPQLLATCICVLVAATAVCPGEIHTYPNNITHIVYGFSFFASLLCHFLIPWEPTDVFSACQLTTCKHFMCERVAYRGIDVAPLEGNTMKSVVYNRMSPVIMLRKVYAVKPSEKI